MELRRNGHRLVLIGVVGVAAAVPAAALAAGQNSVKLRAPRTAHVGETFQYVVSGSSASASANDLSTFVNTGFRCRRTHKGELAAQRAGRHVSGELRYRVTSSHFRGRAKVTSNSTGRHFICAYLWQRSSGKTLAKASHKYITKT